MKTVPIQEVENCLSAKRGTSIDEEIAELLELARSDDADTEVVYQGIRRMVLHDIKYRELAVTAVLRDLREIRERSPKTLCGRGRVYNSQ